VVPAGNVEATAAAIELMLNERTQLRTRAVLADDRDSWRWPTVAEPLLRTLSDLPAVRRSSLISAAARAAQTLLLARADGGWR
jgi:hypothetical protein